MSIKAKLIAGVGGGLLDALMRSTRLELVAGADVEERTIRGGETVVFVLWHGRLLPCSYNYRGNGLGTIITRNRDGDYITGTMERWGYEVIRGSSSRGGAAGLRAIVRALRSGTSVAVTPDGPRGPRQKMKLGPLTAAQMSGAPIVPVAAGAVSAWYFGRWDRFLVPRPFTWIPVAMGTPIPIPRDSSPEALQASADLVEQRLNELTRLVDDAADARR